MAWELGQITPGLDFLICEMGVKRPRDTQTEGQGREVSVQAVRKGQAASGAGPKPVPRGSWEGGLQAEGRREVPQKPPRRAASSRQAPEASDLRNFLSELFFSRSEHSGVGGWASSGP